MTPEEEMFGRKIFEEQEAQFKQALAEAPLYDAYVGVWSEMRQHLHTTRGMLQLVLGEVADTFTKEQKQLCLATALESCNSAIEVLDAAGKLLAPRLRDGQ